MNNPVSFIDRNGLDTNYTSATQEERDYMSSEMNELAQYPIIGSIIEFLASIPQPVNISSDPIEDNSSVKCTTGVCENSYDQPTQETANYYGSNINIDYKKVKNKDLSVKQTLVEEVIHSYQAASNPLDYAKKKRQDAFVPYENRILEVNAKNLTNIIMKFIGSEVKTNRFSPSPIYRENPFKK